MELGSIAAVKANTRAGVGVALLSRHAVERDVAAKQLEVDPEVRGLSVARPFSPRASRASSSASGGRRASSSLAKAVRRVFFSDADVVVVRRCRPGVLVVGRRRRRSQARKCNRAAAPDHDRQQHRGRGQEGVRPPLRRRENLSIVVSARRKRPLQLRAQQDQAFEDLRQRSPCPAPDSEQAPNSMAIDRSGHGVDPFYKDGSLFKASTTDATCQATTFAPSQAGFKKFGMAFAADAADLDEAERSSSRRWVTRSRARASAKASARSTSRITASRCSATTVARRSRRARRRADQHGRRQALWLLRDVRRTRPWRRSTRRKRRRPRTPRLSHRRPDAGLVGVLVLGRRVLLLHPAADERSRRQL